MFDTDSFIIIVVILSALFSFIALFFFDWVQKHPDKAPEWAKKLLKK